MKIFVKELKPGNHTEDITTLNSEYVPHVGDYLHFVANDKVYDYQVCNVHIFYWNPEPEMLSSVIINVKPA